ncbi:hypothetical protein AWL63_20355 [Sphingomonas panacis]|uniref:YbaK/aminoacyl-tRNA synthetase-associated domain-containing protein n=1 Tax=Sphingomonas panacis TaxID=1560345 RepID=A0A1B3ZEW6_9SPHN|nr:YbaK/EbsC family protein [Sphingomonas panacis]AOH85957.1 hypothetical protein AWL63_20355 [Sphingomonas panacis]
MKVAQSPKAIAFQALIGPDYEVLEFDDSTRSAEEAAKAIGCSVDQIAKSIIFAGSKSGRCILVIAPGSSLIDKEKLSALVGEPVRRPDADFVREHTGYAIGGVPPVITADEIVTFVAPELSRFGRLWAAAGTPNAVFSLDYDQLVHLSKATEGDLLQAPVAAVAFD